MTIVELLCSDAARSPDRAALCNAADAIGAALAAHGVRPGDRVGLIADGLDAQTLVAAFAGIAAIRAIAVPVDVRTAYGTTIAIGNRRGPGLLQVARDARGHALVDGAEVFEAHDRVARPEDVVLEAHGRRYSQREVVQAAGIDADGLLAVLRALSRSAVAA